MGPVRRGVILAAAVCVPAGAHAEVCDRIRPDWDGQAVSVWEETLALMGTPVSLLLLLATVLVLRFRSSWGALAVFVGWSFAVASFTFLDGTGGLLPAARAEGCVGSPALFVGVVLLISAGMMLYVNRPKDKDHRI